jgi:hypothetical protein
MIGFKERRTAMIVLKKFFGITGAIFGIWAAFFGYPYVGIMGMQVSALAFRLFGLVIVILSLCIIQSNSPENTKRNHMLDKDNIIQNTTKGSSDQESNEHKTAGKKKKIIKAATLEEYDKFRIVFNTLKSTTSQSGYRDGAIAPLENQSHGNELFTNGKQLSLFKNRRIIRNANCKVYEFVIIEGRSEVPEIFTIETQSIIYSDGKYHVLKKDPLIKQRRTKFGFAQCYYHRGRVVGRGEWDIIVQADKIITRLEEIVAYYNRNKSLAINSSNYGKIIAYWSHGSGFVKLPGYEKFEQLEKDILG